MNMTELYKSVLEADRAAVVICDLSHTIVYMNPAAKTRYEKWGGDKLLGRCLLDCHNENSREMIRRVLDWFPGSTWFVLVRTPDGTNMLVCFVLSNGAWVQAFHTAAAIPQGDGRVRIHFTE